MEDLFGVGPQSPGLDGSAHRLRRTARARALRPGCVHRAGGPSDREVADLLGNPLSGSSAGWRGEVQPAGRRRAAVGTEPFVFGPHLAHGGAQLSVLFAVLLCCGGTSQLAGAEHLTPRIGGKYGGLPSWLPKPKVPVNRIVRSECRPPALAIQGDTVSVNLRAGECSRPRRTTVPETAASGAASSPCTFVVTPRGASGRSR